jgi:hypothetical protein
MIEMLALEIVFLAALFAVAVKHSLAANEIKAARLGIAQRIICAPQ